MEILIIIAICVGVLCFAAILMVGAKVKNSSAGQNEKRLEEISRSIVRLEGAVGESSRLVQAQEARIADMRNKMDADLKYIAETTLWKGYAFRWKTSCPPRWTPAFPRAIP